MFSQSEIDQITAHGMSPQSAQRQWNIVAEGNKRVELVRPATIKDGLFSFQMQEIEQLIADYEAQISGKDIVKFVPASGAATRMFKDLFAAWDNLKANPISPISAQVKLFFEKLPQFAFFDALEQCMKIQGINLRETIENHDYETILEYLLTEKGLNYAHLPKGLLLFHQYDDCKRTAFEEHLVEAAEYARLNDKTSHLHFTVSQEHQKLFEQHCKEILPMYEKRYGIKYEIRFSVQQPSTDTIAFATDNHPFWDDAGNLLFRPGGHGSLILNLNNIDADMVLIKNIDNITFDKHKKDTFTYKKALVCILLNIQRQVFEYLNLFDYTTADIDIIERVELFLKDKFFVSLPASYTELSPKEKQNYLYRLLHRPIRVCGMVKQENEPGGGPFWVKDSDNNLSLQIVETSEMNLSNPRQQEIVNRSLFFNPVDLACSLKNHRGIKFDLNKYVDYSRYFISEKSHKGKLLKAIENPGLWNGAMSDWLTVFVAVPLSTFTPVKTVHDLLR